MQFSADFMLHKIATNGLGLLKGLILPKVKQAQVHAFRPIHIDTFRFPRPHFVWYLRKNEKRILSWFLGLSLVVIILSLLIKNWR